VSEQSGSTAWPDPAAVDAVLTASRSLVAVATRSLGAAAEETTIAQYRALVVRAFADAAGEVPDSEWPAAVAAGGHATERA
jgi:hypothetical protein